MMHSDTNPQQSVMILSDKSSGSSALQRELATHPAVRLVRWTRHNENETLYWVKAAAALGMAQPSMIDSSYIPIGQRRARSDLIEFLEHNAPSFAPPTDDLDLVMAGWNALCREYSPVFLEKSPHHLHSAAALSLIRDAAERDPQTEFKYVGLIRNPTDSLYSMWRRWRVVPEERESEWVRAYTNLLEFSDSESATCLLVRYEDLVSDGSTIERVWRHVGLEPRQAFGFHSESVSRWRSDPTFGYRPSADALELARLFGYTAEQVTPTGNKLAWAVTRAGLVSARRVRIAAGRLRRRIAK